MDTKTHQLTINFQLPIVNDSMEYKNKGKKSGPYVVHEGTRSLTLEPLTGAGSKKKDVERTTYMENGAKSFRYGGIVWVFRVCLARNSWFLKRSLISLKIYLGRGIGFWLHDLSTDDTVCHA